MQFFLKVLRENQSGLDSPNVRVPEGTIRDNEDFQPIQQYNFGRYFFVQLFVWS